MVRFVLAAALSLWIAAVVQAADTKESDNKASSSLLKKPGQKQRKTTTRATGTSLSSSSRLTEYVFDRSRTILAEAGANKLSSFLKKNQQRKTSAIAPTGAVATEKKNNNKLKNNKQAQRKTVANGTLRQSCVSPHGCCFTVGNNEIIQIPCTHTSNRSNDNNDDKQVATAVPSAVNCKSFTVVTTNRPLSTPTPSRIRSTTMRQSSTD
jgi:hypothetical protein